MNNAIKVVNLMAGISLLLGAHESAAEPDARGPQLKVVNSWIGNTYGNADKRFVAYNDGHAEQIRFYSNSEKERDLNYTHKR